MWKKLALSIDCASTFWLRSDGKWQAYSYITSSNFAQARTSLCHLDRQLKTWKSWVLMAQFNVLRWGRGSTTPPHDAIPQECPAFPLQCACLFERACLSATWICSLYVWIPTERAEVTPGPWFALSSVLWPWSHYLLHESPCIPFTVSGWSRPRQSKGGWNIYVNIYLIYKSIVKIYLNGCIFVYS